MSLIINQVKKMISGAIKRYAKEVNDTPDKLGLWIYAPDVTGYPKLKVLYNWKSYKDIEFGDLASKGEKITYALMGFDVDKDTAKWIHAFILKSKTDHEFKDVTLAKYLIALIDEDLHAFMYVNGKQVKEISLDYILETN